MEDRRKQAAEQRRAMVDNTADQQIENMFRTVRAVRTEYKQPQDWKQVTSLSVAEYIPPEAEMTRREIFEYVRRYLDPLGPPPRREPLTASMPLWHATNNQLRTIIHRLLAQRAEGVLRPP